MPVQLWSKNLEAERNHTTSHCDLVSPHLIVVSYTARPEEEI